MGHQTMEMVGQTIPLGRDLDPTMGKGLLTIRATLMVRIGHSPQQAEAIGEGLGHRASLPRLPPVPYSQLAPRTNWTGDKLQPHIRG